MRPVDRWSGDGPGRRQLLLARSRAAGAQGRLRRRNGPRVSQSIVDVMAPPDQPAIAAAEALDPDIIDGISDVRQVDEWVTPADREASSIERLEVGSPVRVAVPRRQAAADGRPGAWCRACGSAAIARPARISAWPT